MSPALKIREFRFPSALPSQHAGLTQNEVHVWSFFISDAMKSSTQPMGLLSVAEMKRAERFLNDTHRNRFRTVRGMLRYLLGGHLKESPSEIPIDADQNGKPKLAPKNPFSHSIEFNVSHSDDFAVIGLSIGTAVGVDVEKIRPIAHIEEITRRYLGTEAWEIVKHARQSDRLAVFFRQWTQAEAWTKAHGSGISSLNPDNLELHQTRLQSPVFDLAVPPGFVATLAILPWMGPQ